VDLNHRSAGYEPAGITGYPIPLSDLLFEMNVKVVTGIRIADEDDSNPVGVRITSSVNRAAAIMRNWTQWSKKGPKRRNIRDGLKPLIETELDEGDFAWNQVYCACKKVEHLTNGKIVFTKHSRNGWRLLQPSSAEGA
jgi:hypothetical protein